MRKRIMSLSFTLVKIDHVLAQQVRQNYQYKTHYKILQQSRLMEF